MLCRHMTSIYSERRTHESYRTRNMQMEKNFRDFNITEVVFV